LSNALLHTTIFELFFLDVHLYIINRFSKVSAFCHDEFFKPANSLLVGEPANIFVISFPNENFLIRIVRLGNHGADYLATVR
jgi:hypothetical protein